MTNGTDQMEKMRKLLHTKESLVPELAAYSYEDDQFGTCIKHPLVFSVMHADFQNAMVNAQLKAKQEALDKAHAEEKWHTVIFLHERPWRLHAFQEIEDKLDDAEYWEHLGSIWTDSENIREFQAEWEMALSSERHDRDRMMDDEEREALALLPERIEVWRGIAGSTDAAHGLSWTIDKARAEWFARRFASHRGEPAVASGVVNKADVLAHFLGRGEDEIVVFPEKVENMVVTGI